MRVGVNNLATLSGRQTYYMQQTPLKSDLTGSERRQLLGHLLASRTARQADHEEAPRVSGLFSTKSAPSVQVEKRRGLNKWLNRMVRPSSSFDIPSYSLDKQPDPERVTHIDVDQRDCLGPIGDQLRCGACYAFSWNSLAEWHYCRQTGGQLIDFSEQFLVDCGSKARLNGCYDGQIPAARAFSQMFGMELERDHPYKGSKQPCRRQAGSMEVQPRDFLRLELNRTNWELTLEEQPILVLARLPDDIMSYQRGVHPGYDCADNFAHGMLLVGHGRQDGVPYWLLRNSMGKNWGENGHLRMSREAPLEKCFTSAYVSKFKFKDLPDGSYDDFYQSLEFEPSVEPERRLAENKAVSKFINSK